MAVDPSPGDPSLGQRLAEYLDEPEGDFLFEPPPQSEGEAPGAAAAVPVINGARALSWRRQLTRKRKGAGFEPDVRNIILAIGQPGLWRRLGFDTFKQTYMWSDWQDKAGAEQWGLLSETMMIEARVLLRNQGFEAVPHDAFRDAVDVVAHQREFDSAQEWLGRLTWDGVVRVPGFLTVYMGASDTDDVRSISRYWWSAQAGRVLEPGVKADMVPILIGPQGIRKTTGVAAMAPPGGYVSLDLSLPDIDNQRRMLGKFVWELSELRGMRSKERAHVNSFITLTADVWTPKYKEFSQDAPRRGVFVGTSNDSDVLDDETGNRRWLPVHVAHVDTEAIARDRDQLWAEAGRIFVSDGVDYKAAEDKSKLRNEEFRIVDEVLEEEILTYLMRNGNSSFSMRELIIGLGHDAKDSTRAKEMRCAKVLAYLGWGKSRGMAGGVRSTIWSKNQ
jgi:predicted P-loop ATPase